MSLRLLAVSEIHAIPSNRQMIHEWVDQAIAAGGLVVKVGKATDRRNTEQNRKAHAMLGDISKQLKHYGQSYSVEVWKRLTMAAWLREEGENPLLIPSLNGAGVDMIFERSSKLSLKRMASYIEWLYAYGAENNINWSRE